MRLLHRDGGRIKVTDDTHESSERYAILSHTWSDDEVAYHELRPNRKIEFLLDQAERDGLQYAWMDTCCIDKRNNSELNEALNSMYQWYADAEVCYVYLTDVPDVLFEHSRWFTRGWTLQELLAPKKIQFFDSNGQFLGDKQSLQLKLEAATGIEQPYNQLTLAERFHNSQNRTTKKAEDLSYCLIGLMDVSLTTCYGEGEQKARERLLDAIEKEHGRKVGREIQKLRDIKKQESKHKQNERTQLLKSLAFEEMFSRQETIDDPFPQTCAWLLEHKDYQRWTAREFPILWVKAKAGAGKSTLMKFAVKQQAKPICFFFNARGNDMEHSTQGLYQSLVWQLVSRLPAESLDYKLAIQWTERRLQNILKHAIGLISEPVTFFIDALDECRQDDVQNMVYLFQDLAATSPKFSVCFASRYYPGITVKDSVELRLDFLSQHDQDIEQFVQGRLDAEADVQQQVITKSSGVFLWAVLVVSILNREIGNGNAHLIQTKLDEIPPDITRLFENLIHDADEQFLFAMQIINFSFSQLTAAQFYIAVMTASGHQATVPAGHILERFIASSTRGLAEITGRQQVQFIHESVRDFLLKHNWLGKLTGHHHDVEANGHELMKDVCYTVVTTQQDNAAFMSYATLKCMSHAMMASDIGQYSFLRRFDTAKFAESLVKVDLPNIGKREFLRNPEANAVHILTYTIASFWQPLDNHLDKLVCTAVDAGIFPDASCIDYAIDGNHVELCRVLTKYLRSPQERGCALVHLSYPWDHSALCNHVLEQEVDLDVQVDARFGLTPLTAAILMDLDITAVRRLLEAGANPNFEAEGGRVPLLLAAHRNKPDIVETLVKHGADINVCNDNGQTPLFMACAEKHYETVSRLLELGANVDCQDKNGHTALMVAIAKVSTCIDVLLSKQPNLELRNKANTTAFEMACLLKKVEAAQSLADAGAITDLRHHPAILQKLHSDLRWRAILG